MSQQSTDSQGKVNVLDMPLNARHYWILGVSSAEQLIGAALSTVVGIMIPMLKMLDPHSSGALIQGLLGASGLLGIALGAPVIGAISDRQGYLKWFRICPLMIMAGSVLVYFTLNVWLIIAGLFIIGLGVGGGYSLDTDYISEMMPTRWANFMVGVAKATSSLGFFAAAAIAWVMIKSDPSPRIVNSLILIVGVGGLITYIARLWFRECPRWLMVHGQAAQAQKDTEYFFGKNAVITSLPSKNFKPTPWLQMFKGENLKKVIFTGLPWACEGVGVYGVGVFLPLLVLALGIETDAGQGMDAVMNSVELTAVINFFTVPGFVLGLYLVRKVYHVRMLSAGFWLSGAGLAVILVAYLLHWPMWISVAGFVLFEICLNAGPHLITFVIPAQIYDIQDRGAGSGIASMFGKIGAILGVFFMPVLLDAGGIALVLAVCVGVSVIGAVATSYYGPKVLPDRPGNRGM